VEGARGGDKRGDRRKDAIVREPAHNCDYFFRSSLCTPHGSSSSPAGTFRTSSREARIFLGWIQKFSLDGIFLRMDFFGMDFFAKRESRVGKKRDSRIHTLEKNKKNFRRDNNLEGFLSLRI
jgi:hypothetical protein